MKLIIISSVLAILIVSMVPVGIAEEPQYEYLLNKVGRSHGMESPGDALFIGNGASITEISIDALENPDYVGKEYFLAILEGTTKIAYSETVAINAGYKLFLTGLSIPMQDGVEYYLTLQAIHKNGRIWADGDNKISSCYILSDKVVEEGDNGNGEGGDGDDEGGENDGGEEVPEEPAPIGTPDVENPIIYISEGRHKTSNNYYVSYADYSSLEPYEETKPVDVEQPSKEEINAPSELEEVNQIQENHTDYLKLALIANIFAIVVILIEFGVFIIRRY